MSLLGDMVKNFQLLFWGLPKPWELSEGNPIKLCYLLLQCLGRTEVLVSFCCRDFPVRKDLGTFTPPKTSMSMEKQPFEDVSPIKNCDFPLSCSFSGVYISYIYIYISGQTIPTSAEVTPNGGLVRESPQNPLNSGLGIIVICPDIYIYNIYI